MKNYLNIAWKAAITLVAFAGLQVAASAQTKEIYQEFNEFTVLNVANDFDVTVCQGDQYSVNITVDEVLAPYLSVIPQGKTLSIKYEEKSVPKEVKKLYSGRNAPKPVFHVVVTMPLVEAITITDNVVLNSTSTFAGGDKFELTALGKAEVKRFNVSARSAYISLQKEATAVMNVNTENTLEVSTDGKSNIRLTSTAGELVLNASGNSQVAVTNISEKLNIATTGDAQVSVDGPCTTATVKAEKSSKVTLTGGGESLFVKAVKSANVDAYGLEVTTASVNLSGSAVLSVNASESLDISLEGGKLYFSGAPLFKIVKIAKASVLPYGTGE